MGSLRPLKNALRTVCGRTALVPPFSGILRKLLLRRSNIIYYHLVSGNPPPHYAEFFAGCTQERFDSDLRTLKKHFEIVPLETILDAGDRGRTPLLSITFDDGFRLDSEVLEILRSHGVKATTFVITSCLDNKNLMWRNKLVAIRSSVPKDVLAERFDRLMSSLGRSVEARSNGVLDDSWNWPMNRKDEFADALWEACDMPPLQDYLGEYAPYMNWDELRSWLDEGHSIGLHTHTHPLCSRLSESEVEDEIARPAETLKGRLGLKEVYFSYPFGSRLPARLEEKVFERGLVSCAFGINGFSTRPTTPRILEREYAEAGIPIMLGQFFLRRSRKSSAS